MGQVGNQSSNFILRLLLFMGLVLAYTSAFVAWRSQLHTMSRVITIFGHRCFGPFAVCFSCQQYGVCIFLLFLLFKFIVLHCYGGSRWVMTNLSANLAEKLRFTGGETVMMGEEHNAVRLYWACTSILIVWSLGGSRYGGLGKSTRGLGGGGNTLCPFLFSFYYLAVE